MTASGIYAIKPDEDGWRRLPNGNYVKLGNGVKLGNDVKLGNGVKLGNYVKLGNGVTLGNYVTLGDDVTLGNYVKLGNGVKLGNYVTLCNGVKLGDGVTCLVTPLQIIGRQFTCYPFAPGIIGIGCTRKPIREWEACRQKLAADHDISSHEAEEYAAYVTMIDQWMSQNANDFLAKESP